jgi:hypothetical protein
MFQTSYTGIKPLQRVFTYVGGFCQFWYIPIEDIAVFPRINAATQMLVSEPSLRQGAAWFGPIEVPRDKLGYEETQKRTKAGPYYETKMEGVHIGDSPESRVNLENMPYHRYLIVGKIRAGGFYNLIGTVDNPCKFNQVFKSGNGPAETAQTAISFNLEHISKAYILPSFAADTISPDIIDGSGGGGTNTMNNKEIIPFNGQPVINIPWTPARQNNFGNFPIVEVWLQEPGEKPFLNIGGSIETDAPPPAFSELNVRLGGSPSGFIVIS